MTNGSGQQPPRSLSSDTANNVVVEGYVYKTCKKSSLVVPRFLSLRQERFWTYHAYEENKANKRSWEFSRNCKLDPRTADDIEVHEKTERPQGKSTLGTLAKGGGKKLQLYCFSVSWPTSWATKGYVSFTLGTDKKEDAMRWHSAFLQQIAYVRQVRASKGLHRRSTSRDSEVSLDMVPDLNSLPQDPRLTTNSLADGTTMTAGSTPDEIPAILSMPSSLPFDPQEEPSSPESDSMPAPEHALSPSVPARSGPRRAHSPAADSAARMAAADAERWVPYRHVNGVAIYYNSCKLADGLGPEYMASSVVRGTPKECLSVLTDNSSLTTLLGPATELSILSGDDKQDTQVLRLQVDAPGFAGRVCAPREVLLERMYLKQEEDNIHVVMFTSKEDLQVTSSKPAIKRQGGGVNPRPCWWTRPVRAKVKGGYTVAPLQGMADDSEESLVTCVLHVDLGGSCSKDSWLYHWTDLCGFGDAFVERMLMGVILVKDVVEHRRFVLAPYSIMSGDDAASSDDEDEPVASTSTARVELDAAGAPRKERKELSRMTSSITVQRTSEGDPASPTTSPDGAKGANLVFCSASSWQLPVVGEDDEPEASSSFWLHCAPPCTLDTKYWCEIHRNGAPSPFKVRGPQYLRDRKKVQAGEPVFTLGAVDLVMLDAPTHHVARFLPSVRNSRAPFAFVVQLIIPGTPVLGLVVTFITEHHPDELGAPPGDPAHSGDWQPFDYLLHKFLKGSDEERNSMFKLIPHVAEGTWVIKQSVGSTPVIMGRKLKTTYHFTQRYVEVDVDISANATATYVVSMVRGALKGLWVDLGFVLEGQAPHELPESLVGAVRFKNMDLGTAVKIDTSKEIPLAPNAPKAAPKPAAQ